jgi:transposase
MNNQTLFVGIDISKLKHDVAFMSMNKQLIGQTFVIKDDLAGYQHLLVKLNAAASNHQIQQFKIGLEATSDYWKNIYYFLNRQSDKFQLTVINPVQTHNWAKTELRRAKTDPLDAKEIALFMLEKNPAPTVPRQAILDIIKDMDRQIYAIGKQQTISKNRLRLELTKVAPELEKATTNLNAKRVLAVLKAFPTAQDICGASFDELTNIGYGKRNWQLPASFVEKLKTLSQQSIAYKTGFGAGFVVQSLVRQIIGQKQELDQLKEQIVQLYQRINDQESLLTTIPGIRRETAIVLEAYIGDVNRFPNAKKIVAYFGMNPTIHQSGKSKRKSQLQKKGSPIVRQKLFMAVICIIGKKSGPVYRYYQRLVDSGKPKMVAIGAAMRKLLVTIYAMLKNQQSFDENKL